MTVIATGNIHRIFSDDVKTYDTLPCGTYTVGFHPQQGFFLEKIKDISRPEGKIYGKHEKMANRIVSSYEKKSGSFGAILSGNKGTGKTITASLVSSIMNDKGIPTVIVNRNEEGISDFIASIDSPMFVFFDEFEKKFPNDHRNTNEWACTTQQDLLVLFDGVTKNNNLYVVATNSANKNDISAYLMGRPGRFHYHISYGEMDMDVIGEYIEDHIDSNVDVSADELDRAVKFCYRSNLSFDSISALCFELNIGSTLDEAASILNIFDSIGDETTKDIENMLITFSVEGCDGLFTENSSVSTVKFNSGRIYSYYTSLKPNTPSEDDLVLEFDIIGFHPESIIYHADGSMEIPRDGIVSLTHEGQKIDMASNKFTVESIVMESPYKVVKTNLAV